MNPREPLFLTYLCTLHSDVTGDTVIETKPANPKAGEWAERIAAQQRSGMSVKQFCKEQGLTEYSFYAWRERLQEKGPVRFAIERWVASELWP